MVSTDSLLIGGVGVAAAFVLTRGSTASGASASTSNRQPTGPTNQDVLDTISAFNEGTPGVPYQDIIYTISAFNEQNG